MFPGCGFLNFNQRLFPSEMCFPIFFHLLLEKCFWIFLCWTKQLFLAFKVFQIWKHSKCFSFLEARLYKIFYVGLRSLNRRQNYKIKLIQWSKIIIIISSVMSSSVHHGLLYIHIHTIMPIYIHNLLSLSFSVQYTEQNQAILLHELHWQRMHVQISIRFFRFL